VALRPYLAYSSVEDFDRPGTLEPDQERRRIARDRHDGLTQELVQALVQESGERSVVVNANSPTGSLPPAPIMATNIFTRFSDNTGTKR